MLRRLSMFFLTLSCQEKHTRAENLDISEGFFNMLRRPSLFFKKHIFGSAKKSERGPGGYKENWEFCSRVFLFGNLLSSRKNRKVFAVPRGDFYTGAPIRDRCPRVKQLDRSSPGPLQFN